ncbi:MAG: DNA polymerase III subunit beta [Gammaproteobacteria bacterium]
MKFIINREQLLTPLQQIVSVIEKRQTMPILANLLLNIIANRITLTGTDLEVQLVAHIGVDTQEEGAITVPARKLLDICRLLPAQADIKFEMQGDKIKVTSGRGKYMLSTLPADDYPEFVETPMECEFSLRSGQLKKALDKTLFAMGNQDVRYYLNGLLLHLSNSQLKLVASDGHRLALYEDQLDVPSGQEMRVIVPRKGIVELNRLLDASDQPLTVQLSNNNVRIFNADLTFSAKLIDAKYPDFSKVMKQAFFDPLLVEKAGFKDALTRVAILSNEKFRGVTLDIHDNNVKVSTHNPEHEEAEEYLPVDYPGNPLNIAFNVQYLLDAVGNLDSEQAKLTIANNCSCCFIDEPDPCNYRYVVMPMRL